MRSQWYRRDSGLSIRMFLTMFFLGVIYLAFLALLVGVGVGYVPLLLIAAVLLLMQYYFSDKMVLWSMGARVVRPDEAPELHATVERLCLQADLPKPKVAVVEHPMPNAFATGRNPKNAVVAVTTGILQRLDREELEGVLAHELTHVKNRDVMVITIASFLSTVAFLIMRSFMFVGYGRGRGRDSSGQIIILIYLASMLVWLLSFFLIRALSRYREFAADRGSAVITGAPSALASALLKISGVMQRIPQRDLREVEAMNAFFIVPAVSGGSFMELFSTHPSLEKRLERLRHMQQEMEGSLGR